ncbi:MAG: response regulator, partial [Lachnospiraceae bacterium]|nr:response regulator [Lachnospiraceae bacterium]
FSAPDAWIMVVDDNPMNLMVFKSLLKQTRVHIDTAGTGDEGLSLSGDKKYDIIFLDHMMPEKDGIETLHEMRTWKNNPNADTPVVCLTANAIAGARENYIDQGFDDYMTKPIDPVILEEMLLTYLPKDKIKMTAVGQDQVKSSGSGKKGKIKEDAIPAFVQDIDELDTAVGIKQSGSTQTYLETLRMFAGMSGTYASQIEDYVAVGDMKNATIKIHSLKSTLRIIGAADLGELAQKLENAGKSDDRDLLDRELGKLLKRTGELGNKLMPLTEDKAGKSANDTEKGKTDIGEAQLKEEYKKIKALAEDCDNAGIEEILDRIKALNVPENERERLDALTKAVDDFDFEAIIKCLK